MAAPASHPPPFLPTNTEIRFFPSSSLSSSFVPCPDDSSGSPIYPPPEHLFENGRGVAFSAATPWSVLDRALVGTLSTDGENPSDPNVADTILSIATCIPAVQLVERALFCPSSPVVDIDTVMLIEIADIFHIHPDSVRKVAYYLHDRWKKRHPFTFVRSYAVLDPSKMFTDRDNMCQTHTVNYAYYRPYDPATHCAELTCEKEFRHADFKNYLYVPTKQPIKNEYRLVLYSCLSKYSPAPLAKFKAAVSNLKAIDANWYRNLCVAVVDRMSARFVLHICCEVVASLNMTGQTTTAANHPASRHLFNCVVHFQREKKVVPITFDATSNVCINGPSLINVLTTMGNTAENLNRCKQCGINHSRVRCKHCCELRYCTEACRDAEWVVSHKAQCKVFAKKTSGLAQPPGGASMIKEKEKQKEANEQQTNEQTQIEGEWVNAAPGGPRLAQCSEEDEQEEDMKRL